MAVAVKNIKYVRNELINSVSHDLRVPLSRLRFSLELLKNCDQKTLLKRIAEMEYDIEELEDIVDDVLNTMDGETVEVPVELHQCELNLILSLMMSRFKKNSTKKLIMHSNNDSADFYTLANKKYLLRVLQNLLDNANKFANSTIQVSLQKKLHNYQIIIEDDGKGIPAKHRSQVFESRVQLEPAKKSYGLGLSIVKKIVNFHGWKIHLSTSTLGGLKVVLIIPN